MLTPDEARIVQRKLLQKLDIGGHGDTGIGSFDQIVAEQGFCREAIREYRPERMHIVDRFPVKDTFVRTGLAGRPIRCGNKDPCRRYRT